jgi:hypothetical protein
MRQGHGSVMLPLFLPRFYRMWCRKSIKSLKTGVRRTRPTAGNWTGKVRIVGDN